MTFSAHSCNAEDLALFDLKLENEVWVFNISWQYGIVVLKGIITYLAWVWGSLVYE